MGTGAGPNLLQGVGDGDLQRSGPGRGAVAAWGAVQRPRPLGRPRRIARLDLGLVEQRLVLPEGRRGAQQLPVAGHSVHPVQGRPGIVRVCLCASDGLADHAQGHRRRPREVRGIVQMSIMTAWGLLQ